MTGIAALSMCFGFTSCSHEIDNLSQEEIDQMKANEIVENYKKAFVAQFGQPAADQDWGFGTTATRGVTRSISDMQPGANKNRNLWAATDGAFNLLVPTPLTAGQKLRVQKYFQAHPNLTWEAPDMTNYFVQQVYKGSNTTAGAYSAEQYPQGNGSIVVGSNHMDQLTIGANNVHVLDFNYGDNPNTAADVKNNGTLTNDTQYHSDQITLMIGVQPTCVGYESSDGSVKRNDCMALAGAKAIDDWARAQNPVIGEDVWYGTDQYGYENKSWNRSFVGLDYEQKTLEECYAVDYSTGSPVSPSYVTVDQTYRDYFYMGKDANNNNIILSKAQYKAQYGNYLLDKDGNKIPWITDQTNQICGTNVDFPNQDTYMPRMDCRSAGGGNNDQVLDMTLIQGKLDQNAYPALNGGLQKWVKDIGGRDYVYSDWIVTLAPARENTQTPPPPSDNYSIRVIAEDLTFGTDLDTDFDFNDVVFDVCLKATETKIRLKAAGGTLPLIIGIANPQNDQDYLANEVHEIFGVQVNVMVNTNAHLKGLNSANKEDKFLTLNTTYNNAKDIPVYVKKNGAWVQLTAVQGEPASKIGVDINFQWVNERQSMKGNYPLFVDWVQADAEFRSQIKWW